MRSLFLLLFSLLAVCQLSFAANDDKSEEEYQREKEEYFRQLNDSNESASEETSKTMEGEDQDLIDKETRRRKRFQKKVNTLDKTLNNKGDQKDLDSLIKNFESYQKLILEKGGAIFGKDGKGKPTAKDLSKFYFETLAPGSPSAEEDMIEQMKDATRGTLMGKIFEKYPKILIFYVRVMQDQKAMNGLFKLIDNRKKLTTYAVVMLVTLLMGIILKIKANRHEDTAFKQIKGFFKRFILMNLLRLAITVFFFKEELGPVWDILVQVIQEEKSIS